jgi:hypothetical protein
MKLPHSQVMEFFAKPDKKLPEWQYFLSCYYDTMVRLSLDWAAHLKAVEDGKEEPKHPLAWRNQATQAAYKLASDEIKAKIKQLKHLSEQRLEDLVL